MLSFKVIDDFFTKEILIPDNPMSAQKPVAKKKLTFLVHHELAAILVAVLQWRKPRNLTERGSESLCIGVSNLIHNFIDVLLGTFKIHFCR